MRNIFCLINEKGGVGKTSSCFHLAGAFAASGNRVLVIDMDPQASLTRGFFGPDHTDQLPLESSVASLFDESGGFVDWSSLVHATSFDRLHVCPTNQMLADFNRRDPETLGMMQYTLREFIEGQDEYDVVLIDCPPNLYSCSWTAMLARDWVIIPVTPEDFGTQGLRAVHQAVANVRNLNPKIRRLGHLLTRADSRLQVHQQYEQTLRRAYGDLILNNIMRELSAFKLAVAQRMPVEYYDPRSRAAELTRSLSREILDRTDARIGNTKREHGDKAADTSTTPT